jgi:hypothetical protein
MFMVEVEMTKTQEQLISSIEQQLENLMHKISSFFTSK